MNTGFSRKKLYTYDGTYHCVARFLINLRIQCTGAPFRIVFFLVKLKVCSSFENSLQLLFTTVSYFRECTRSPPGKPLPDPSQIFSRPINARPGAPMTRDWGKVKALSKAKTIRQNK